MQEINSRAKHELYHILIMIKVLLVDKKKMEAMEELSEDLFTDPNLLGADYFRKLKLIVFEFEKRGWLME